MIRIVMLAAALLVIGSAAATAQEKDCFAVIMPPTHGPAGAILVNKCTGMTWIATYTDIQAGIVRWYPIAVEKAPR
jgi:hypothetical protein